MTRFCECGSRPGEGRRGAGAMLRGLPGATGGSVAVWGDRDEFKKEGVPFVCLPLTG